MDLYREDLSPSSPIAETNSLSSGDPNCSEKLTKVKPASFKSTLEAFDQTFETAIDYFAIIGFDETQIKEIISEIQRETEMPKPIVSKRTSGKVNTEDFR